MTTLSTIAHDTCPHCKADLTELRQLSNPPTYCLQCRFPIVLIANKYQLIRILGEGGFGSVYLAKHVRLKRNAERVVKLLKPDMFARAGMEERFYREVQVTSDLSQRNEHIVRIYDDFGEVPQLGRYYVMEYLQGKPLTDYILADRVQPMTWTLDIFGQLCDAIQAAHEEGIIHRDLKPDNILLIERRNNPYFVKVLDFGIAKPTQDSGRTDLNLTQGALGTPMYMPPEQAMNRPIDGRSDIYSMGLILYELLTGRHPFIPPNKEQNMSPLELLTAQMMHDPPALRDIRPDLHIPQALDHATLKALAKLPEQRYQSVQEFWQALCSAVPGIPLHSITTTREERPPLPTPAETQDSQSNMAALRTTYAPAHSALKAAHLSENQMASLPPTGEHASPSDSALPSGDEEKRPFLRSSDSGNTSSPSSFSPSDVSRPSTPQRNLPTSVHAASEVEPVRRPIHPRALHHSLANEDVSTSSRLSLWLTLSAVAVVLLVVILFASGFFSSPTPPKPEPRKRVIAQLEPRRAISPQPRPDLRHHTGTSPISTTHQNANTNAHSTDATKDPNPNTNENVETQPEDPSPVLVRQTPIARRKYSRRVPPRTQTSPPVVYVAPRRPDPRAVETTPPPANHGCPDGQIRLRIRSCSAGGGKFTLTLGNQETTYKPGQTICLLPKTTGLAVGQEGCRDCILRLPSGKIMVQLYLKDDSDENNRLSQHYCLRP